MNKIIRDICKIGQREKCCRYLMAGSSGMECAKIYPELKSTIDGRINTMTAISDNCEGKTIDELNK